MADMMDKVATARASGYSDDEIVQFLSSKGDLSPKIKQAKDAGYSSSDIINHFVSKLPAASKGPADATQIESNPEWAKRGRTIYKSDQGKDFEGSDQDAAKWLKGYIYDFNNRLIGTGTEAGRGTLDIAYNIGDYSPEAKKAFVDAQNDYEKMGYSWNGAGEVAKRIMTDPTTYAGLGFGKLFTKGAQVAATEGVKELAKRGAAQGLKEGVKVGATEGAIYGGATDAAKQAGMINADGQDSYNPLQTAESAGIGALGGGVIGGAVGGVTGAVAGRNPYVKAARQIVEDPEKARINAEFTQKLADIQGTRDAPIQLSDANQAVDILRSGVMRDVKGAGQATPEQMQQLAQAMVKARAMTPEDIAGIQDLPHGEAIAKQIQVIKQARDMVQPESADKGVVKKALRTLIDYAPMPKVVGDAVKYAFLSPRKSGEQVIASAISPKNLDIAQKVTELAGQSEAAQARQSLSDAANSAKQVVEAHKALLKATSSKLDEQAIARNEVPGGGAFKYAHYKTGLKPQEVSAGIDQLVAEGTIPPQIAQIFKDEPLKLKDGNVLNKVLDRLNQMADSGVLPRDPKWTPNSGEQVMQGAYSPAMAQANANQARVTATQGRVSTSNAAPEEIAMIKSRIAQIGATNNKQEAAAILKDLLNDLKTDEGKQLAQMEIPALIEQIRHKTPEAAKAARKRQ